MRAGAAFGLLLVGLLAAMPASGQDATVRVRGAILGLDADVLRIASREGPEVAVRLAPDYRVSALVPAQLAAIGEHDFVGTAAEPMPDGRLRALEVVVFPEAARGAGEGQRDWDLTPQSTMTNATVARASVGADGKTLVLRWGEREATVLVPDGTPIVTFEPAGPELLKPGNHVFVVATRQGDGSLSAARVSVGRDGLVPPM